MNDIPQIALPSQHCVGLDLAVACIVGSAAEVANRNYATDYQREESHQCGENGSSQHFRARKLLSGTIARSIRRDGCQSRPGCLRIA